MEQKVIMRLIMN